MENSNARQNGSTLFDFKTGFARVQELKNMSATELVEKNLRPEVDDYLGKGFPVHYALGETIYKYGFIFNYDNLKLEEVLLIFRQNESFAEDAQTMIDKFVDKEKE